MHRVSKSGLRGRAALGPTARARARPGLSGRALPKALLSEMKRALGHDFATVRVHEDHGPRAHRALAFARAESLHFKPGLYQPETSAGRRLIGHELAHVVQQRQARVTIPKGGQTAVNSDPALEAEAQRAGDHAAEGGRMRLSLRPAERPEWMPQSGGDRAAAPVATPDIGAGVRTPIQLGKVHDSVKKVKRPFKQDPKSGLLRAPMKRTAMKATLRRAAKRGIARRERGRFELGEYSVGNDGRNPMPIKISGGFRGRVRNTHTRKEDYGGQTQGGLARVSDLAPNFPDSALPVLWGDKSKVKLSDAQRLSVATLTGITQVSDADKNWTDKFARAVARKRHFTKKGSSPFDQKINPSMATAKRNIRDSGGGPRGRAFMHGDEDFTAEQLDAMQYFSDSSDDDDPVAAERLGIVRKKKKGKARK